MKMRLLLPIVNASHGVRRFTVASNSLLKSADKSVSLNRFGCAGVRTMATAEENRSLSYDNLNPNIKVMEYAVRGPIVIRAGQISKELQQGVKKPFNEVIRANIGDCHAMGQVPITFIRQVLSTVLYTPLLDDPIIPDDAKQRARDLIKACGGSVGCYTDSTGLELVRRHVANYIEKRDGYPSDWQNILLCGGASDGIKNFLKLFVCQVDGKPPGVMIPIPQYPLYSASLAEMGISQIGYYLDESNNWALNVSELERALEEKKETCIPKCIVVINPGNPTGQVLTKKNIQEIIQFAHKHSLFILADEVYQHNIYAEGSEFFAFKKILMEMGKPYSSMELISFMSCSKGYMGECGLRGGYGEVINMSPKVKVDYLKSISAMLCSTVIGQACMDTVVNPPQEGEPSYDLYMKERTAVLQSLNERAKLVVDTFNSFEGFTCNPVQGAMYAFPKFTLPPKAIEAAKKANQNPDVFYAFQLLERTGVCIVPGSGFGQIPGTFHFRTTILPQPEKLKVMLEKFRTFHLEFVEQYK